MRKPWLVVTALAVSLIAVTWGYGAFISPYPAGGWWGMMGPGMMGGSGAWNGYGSCPMCGYGPGAMGPDWGGPRRNLNLTTDNVKASFERWLAWQGNPRLKLGEVKDKDANTITVDIVTRDNSLVQRFAINRHDGRLQPSED